MEERPVTTVVVLQLSSHVGELVDVLTVFKKLEVGINHIESRESRENMKDFYIEFPSQVKDKEMTLLKELRELSTDVTVHYPSTQPSTTDSQSKSNDKGRDESTIPWFPKSIRDLKRCCTVYKFGQDLSPEIPGYEDSEYMERRKEIAQLAYGYEYGRPIPTLDYKDFELETWSRVYRAQTALYESLACKEYRENYPALFEACGYREDNIPQLEDVSRYLRSKTGWQVWPVVGWISSRDFLNCLAFRVFPTTQYVRHKSTPFLTPEPMSDCKAMYGTKNCNLTNSDICHEALGHAPLFCDPSFARFSQVRLGNRFSNPEEIGLASLGVSDEWITKLAGVYWFTVEFGVVRENDQLKAYGAGILSANKELSRCTSDQPDQHSGSRPEHRTFNIDEMLVQEFPEKGLQPIYYVVDSLDLMKNKMIEFAKTIPRPFSVSYDPYTQSVRVLDSWQSVESHAADVQKEMDLLCDALKRKCC